MFGVPFSREQFFDVFAAYNTAVWPAQLLLVALALAAAALALRGAPARGRWISGVLALLWLWSGIAYHLVHFTVVNPAAWLFGALFVLQGLGFAWYAVRGGIAFVFDRDAAGVIGALAVFYALVVYPVIGALAGHAYPAAPTFGAPCPVVIFTFGMLALTRGHLPGRLLLIPAFWAVVGSTAMFAFGVRQDAGMAVAALLLIPLLLRRNRTLAGQPLTEVRHA